MAVENRDLPIGTRLVANYKKQAHVCEVGQDGEGKLTFTVAGKEFKSPSSAAMHVMGGKAVNGWRFWSVEGTATTTLTEAEAESKPEKATKKAKTTKLISRIPNQKGTAEGMTRFWCTACMKSFESAEAEPTACPGRAHRSGHRRLHRRHDRGRHRRGVGSAGRAGQR